MTATSLFLYLFTVKIISTVLTMVYLYGNCMYIGCAVVHQSAVRVKKWQKQNASINNVTSQHCNIDR